MKKIKREDVIKLLRRKGNRTFRELSEITGYHEKSLSRIWKNMKEGTYTEIHQNKGRKPHNKIEDKEKADLIIKFKSGKYFTKKSFCQDLCKNGYSYSYSFIAKLVKKEKRDKKIKQKQKNIIVPRKLIAKNSIQYRNKRYFIKTSLPINHHECVKLIVDSESLTPLFIKYRNKKYYLVYQKDVISKKGNTKY